MINFESFPSFLLPSSSLSCLPPLWLICWRFIDVRRVCNLHRDEALGT